MQPAYLTAPSPVPAGPAPPPHLLLVLLVHPGPDLARHNLRPTVALALARRRLDHVLVPHNLQQWDYPEELPSVSRMAEGGPPRQQWVMNARTCSQHPARGPSNLPPTHTSFSIVSPPTDPPTL